MADEKLVNALEQLRQRQGITTAPAVAPVPVSANRSHIDTRAVIGECEHCSTGFKVGEVKCSACNATLPIPGKLTKKQIEQREAERKEREEKARIAKQQKKAKVKKISVIAGACIAALVIIIVSIAVPISISKKNAEKGLFYKRYDNGWEITRVGTSYKGTDLIISETRKGKPVLKIKENAFRNNKTIKSVTIPLSIKEIGVAAFSELNTLERVTFAPGANPSVIGADAFAWCSNLTKVTLASSMETLGYGMFHHTAVQFVDIPSVAIIPDEIFRNCAQLKAVYIKKGTKTIGSNAFSSCSGLVEFFYEGTSSEWLAVNQSGSGIPSIPLSTYISAVSDDGTLYLVEYVAPYNGYFAVGATRLFNRTAFTIPESLNGIAISGVIMDSFGGTQLTIPPGMWETRG